jgi:hypothetical protein
MGRRLPKLSLADWRPTRDTLHQYARIVGRVRGRFSPRSKHWWHITLGVSARGLTSTPIHYAGQSVEIALDLAAHRLTIDGSEGWCAGLPLTGQGAAGLCRQLTSTLSVHGVELDADILSGFEDESILPYDQDAAAVFRQIINWVDGAFKTFKGGLREETSPVQLFPHHMDLAMNWFSGRLVPGVDPMDEEAADEQMNFGFLTGDGSIADAYFYATSYPAPMGWTELTLPRGAYWHTEGWTGAVLPYSVLVESSDPLDQLLDYLRSVHTQGAALMT